MPESKSKLTQKDVARAAGVSQAVVSHVLNQTDKAIPEETRQRVLEAIEELGYTPNKAARSLRGQRTYTIACIIPDITNAFFPAFLRGIQQVADQHHFDLIIYDSHTSAEKERRYLCSLTGGHVDGAVVLPFYSDRGILSELLEKGLHLVTFEAGVQPRNEEGHDLVYVDNVSAAYTAVDYLIKRKHTRIGILAGTVGTPPQRSRLSGYKQALKENDLAVNKDFIRWGDYTETGGCAEMKSILALPEKPTAVFAANDLMAIGAMLAVQKAGLRVPEDIAIMGFDDIPAARLVNPPLTTVTQFQEEIGKQAAELLFERIAGGAPDGARSVEMPFEIVVRESA
jgi:LacI family transcriptional regulator